jgi:hypothetical protein
MEMNGQLHPLNVLATQKRLMPCHLNDNTNIISVKLKRDCLQPHLISFVDTFLVEAASLLFSFDTN